MPTLRPVRRLALAALALALLGPAATAAPAATRAFSCTQSVATRYPMQVTGTLSSAGTPTKVQVWRKFYGTTTYAPDHYAAAPRLESPYTAGGLFYPNQFPGYAGWNLGTEPFGAGGVNRYYLLLADGAGTSTSFSAQVHLFFDSGRAGWWQRIMACTAA